MDIDDIPTAAELDAFRADLRGWLVDHLPRLTDTSDPYDQTGPRLRELQSTLWQGGYAGLCFPEDVGGRGLTRSHQRVFCEEADGYELPIFIGNPGLSIISPPILEFGTPEQKRHITGLLRGDEIFVQMMSEPGGGSDMAGARTRAERDGETWILNGSKIWSSGAFRSDWGLILVRTNWDVPKHRGLSMFLLDLTLPGITVNRIRMVNGSEEFCQEFFDDVPVPADCLLGEPDDGWTVASRLLFHERNAVGGGSPYSYPSPGRPRNGSSRSAATRPAAPAATRPAAPATSRPTSPPATTPEDRQLIGEAHANQVVAGQLIRHVTEEIESGRSPAIAGSLLRLNMGLTHMRALSIDLELAGADGVTWPEAGAQDAPAAAGEAFIFRQGLCIGGGTNEMQRNLISERLLGMPREPLPDRDRPFREIRAGAHR